MPASIASDEFVPLRLYSLVIFIFLMAILKSINFKQGGTEEVFKKIFKTPIHILFYLLFIASTVMSSIFSVDPSASWFGVYSMRTGGIFLIICLFIFLIYNTAKNFSWTPFIFSIFIINLITISEYLGFRPLAFILERSISLTSLFPAATIGLRQHLAGLLTFTTLLIIPIYIKRNLDYKFWLYLVISSVALGCTNNTSSYSAILGTALFLILSRKRHRLHHIMIPVVIFSSMLLYKPLKNLSDYLAANGVVNKSTANKVITNPTTFKTRLILWESATQMTLKKPILGWGLQTFNNQWYNNISQNKGDRLFRMELGLSDNQKMVRINDSAAYKNTKGETEQVILNYTSSHSALLDLAYSQGILGVGLFLTAILLSIFRNPNFSTSHIAYMSVPLIGYSIYLIAWFITVPTTSLVVIITGILWNKNLYSDRVLLNNSEKYPSTGGDI
ncbi:O-antigen ligase family protein [Deinococcus actinosclerus]|uniref:O-antigen ligase family protein n=1 Tax=Deinococcus actinosclerus TaxID=1768108 RepID=UPI0018D239B7|nr:O-antigen ligase family protein [Deinococcus actinosclerus]